jgi:hypothetical protein
MSGVIAGDLSDLMAARRLIEIASDAEARRNGKKVAEKSALDYLKTDQAFISGAALDANQQNAVAVPVENINIKLPDLRNLAQAVENTAQQAAPTQAGITLTASQSIEIQLELSYKSNAPLEGLLVHDQNYAESDRYLFNFKDGATFTIIDKWANKSTTVWGDPHVDVDDVEGNNDGDFGALKSSDDFTTFMLGDGTRLTFKARDNGLIEQVDIYKGSQHVTGLGQAAKDFSPASALFSKKVLADGHSAALAKPLGDVVYAGGDGNDWFDANQRLIWGKTTAPLVTQRPPATLTFSYKQTVTQSISIQTIARDA